MPDEDWEDYMSQDAADTERKLVVMAWALFIVLSGAVWYGVWRFGFWLGKAYPAFSMALGLVLMACAVAGFLYLCLRREGK